MWAAYSSPTSHNTFVPLQWRTGRHACGRTESERPKDILDMMVACHYAAAAIA